MLFLREPDTSSPAVAAVAPPAAAAGGAPVFPPADPNAVRNAFLIPRVNTPIGNGWKPLPLQANVTYTFKKGDGPIINTSLSATQMAGGKLLMQWPECPGWVNRLWIDTNLSGDWHYLNKERSVTIDASDGLIRMKGDSQKPDSFSTSVFLKITPPSDGATRVRMEKLLPSGGIEEWGELPTTMLGRPISWELVVQL